MHIAFKIQKSSERVWHVEKYLKMMVNKPKYFSTCRTRSDDFWILNAMCMFMYLFVVYFSFAPVISASTHRYVNYFISKSWWWLINRNVNVDFTSWYIHLFGLYFFLLPSYCRILSIFTFILSFWKKHIPNTFLHNI